MAKVRAAVIGAGFGGLATAIRLQARGIDTTLFEKRDKPGGRAYVFKDEGFTFDAGPTVITAPEALDELFAEAGREVKDYVEMKSVSPFYRLCWEDGSTFDYSNDEEALFEQIRKRNPADVEGYKRFFKYSEKVFEAGYSELVHVPFLKMWDMARVAPQLIKLKAYQSVYKVVSSFIQDEKLRQAFSFHSLLIGGNPFEASSIYTLIHALERKWGVYFPKGGTNALVSAMAKLFEEIGGKLYCNAEIDEVCVEDSRVTGVKLKDGTLHGCDLAVSNGDVTQTYQHLLRGADELKPRAKAMGKKRYSNSLFVLYFGTDKKYPELAHHSILFGPRYEELLRDIFKRGVVADDFSLYLHAPCRSDASLAPEGCDTFYALAPVPHMGICDKDWTTFGPQFADVILDYLEKRYMPDVRCHIVTKRIFTPLDFKTELNAHLGSAFSLEPTLLQSAYFRVHNRDPQVSNMYFVGAGTHPGAGVPGVINSAKATAGVILSDLKEIPEFAPQFEKGHAYA